MKTIIDLGGIVGAKYNGSTASAVYFNGTKIWWTGGGREEFNVSGANNTHSYNATKTTNFSPGIKPDPNGVFRVNFYHTQTLGPSSGNDGSPEPSTFVHRLYGSSGAVLIEKTFDMTGNGSGGGDWSVASLGQTITKWTWSHQVRQRSHGSCPYTSSARLILFP